MANYRATHRVANDAPSLPLDYPEHVAGFTDLGFVWLGRVELVPAMGLERLADDYDEPDRTRFLEYGARPAPVLQAPDNSAFVEVSWFWDSPSVRVRTELGDGSLVETLRRWEAPPAMPRTLKFRLRRFDIDKDMHRETTAPGGRAVRVVADAMPAEMWAEHRRHVGDVVAARGAAPVFHHGIRSAMGIFSAAYAHEVSIAKRRNRVLLITLTVLMTAANVVAWILCRDLSVGWRLAAVSLVLATSFAFSVWGSRHFWYLPTWLRPAYVARP